MPDAVLEIPKDDRVVAFVENPATNAVRLSAKAHVIAFQQFLASVEHGFLCEMRRVIHDELGCRALVADIVGDPNKAEFYYEIVTGQATR